MKKTKLERTINKCKEYKECLVMRKNILRQYEDFCDWLIKNNRCTKEEMRPFFKRKKDIKLS